MVTLWQGLAKLLSLFSRTICSGQSVGLRVITILRNSRLWEIHRLERWDDCGWWIRKPGTQYNSQYLSLQLILALELLVLEGYQNNSWHFMDTFKFRVIIWFQGKTSHFLWSPHLLLYWLFLDDWRPLTLLLINVCN